MLETMSRDCVGKEHHDHNELASQCPSDSTLQKSEDNIAPVTHISDHLHVCPPSTNVSHLDNLAKDHFVNIITSSRTHAKYHEEK